MKTQETTNSVHTQKTRVMVEGSLSLCDEAFAELHRLADQFNWQLLDFKLCKNLLPTNPAPGGAIIQSQFGSDNPEDTGRVFDFPTVRWGNVWFARSEQYPRVLTDIYAAGQMAMKYFVENNYKNVVIFIRNAPQYMSQAYRGAMDWAGECDDIMLYIHQLIELPDENRFAKQERWVKQVGDTIAELPKPLGFFGCNDGIAAKFCHDCQSYGYSIPEDVAVLGLNNDCRICETAPVKLSSIDTNDVLAVREAAHLLKRLMDGEKPPDEPILIPPKGVVTRRSTDVLAVEDPRVARAVRFMWDHLDWPITVDDVSLEVGVSNRTLTRLFKNNLGRGVIEELRRKRLERTCELLLNTDLVIDDISRSVGFPSPSYLYRSFQDAYGRTPGAYRSQERKKLP